MSQLSFILLSERPELRKALESSGHAEVIASLSDLDELVRVVHRRRPDALLADLSTDPEGVLDELDRLPAPRPLLLVSGPPESTFILRAMRLGAREYVSPSPVEGREIAEAVERLVLEQPAVPAEGHRAPVLAVMGSKGGVGATFTACQLAAGFARKGAQVVVVDLNLLIGDVALYFDMEPKHTLADLASQQALDAAYLHSVLETHSSGVRVLAAPMHVEEAGNVDPDQIEHALGMLRKEFDWVVVDTSRSFDEPTVRALDVADQIILVTIPDIPTLSHTRLHLDLLQRLGHPPEQVRIVANRVDGQSVVSGRELAQFLGRKIDARLPNDYRSALACVNEGKPIREVAPRRPLSSALERIAERAHEWCDVPLPEGTHSASGLSRLFRRR